MTPQESTIPARDIVKWAEVVRITINRNRKFFSNGERSISHGRRDVRMPIPTRDILRGPLGLTGPHFGCGAGECGACNVIIGDRAVSRGHAIVVGRGKDVTTVEGLGSAERPHPLQRAFIADRRCNAAIACRAS